MLDTRQTWGKGTDKCTPGGIRAGNKGQREKNQEKQGQWHIKRKWIQYQKINGGLGEILNYFWESGSFYDYAVKVKHGSVIMSEKLQPHSLKKTHLTRYLF